MSRLISIFIGVTVVCAALVIAAPAITRIVQALVPLLTVLGILWICLELVRYYTRR